MINFVDPNWPENDDEIDFPINVISGWELGIEGKWVTCPRTMTINDKAEFLKLFEEWSQMEAQKQAQIKAKELNIPVDDGYGSRHFPPGEDGLPIIGPTPT